MSEYKKRIKCAICGNEKLFTIVDYGDVPLAGHFPKKEELNNIKKYNLGLQYCPNCHLMQTNSIVDASFLFKDYRYMSSVSLQRHFNEYSKYLIERFKLNGESKVLEIGSNDGVLLKPLMNLGINPIGIDPSENISQMAINKGCTVIVDFFNYNNAKMMFEENSFDLITASNTFAHIDNIHSVVKAINFCLKKNGNFIFEVHYGKNIIEELQYDNIYHEHLYYYTIHALRNLFDQYDMTIVNVDEISLHSGSIRVTVANEKLKHLEKKILEEQLLGINNHGYYENFSERVYEHKTALVEMLVELKKQGKTIGAYGASGRANILCNFAGIDNSLIDYIIDESPERQNRFINNIPILSPDNLNQDTDYILIFAWNYSKMIMSKLVDKYDFTYIIPFPIIRKVSHMDEIDNINSL